MEKGESGCGVPFTASFLDRNLLAYVPTQLNVLTNMCSSSTVAASYWIPGLITRMRIFVNFPTGLQEGERISFQDVSVQKESYLSAVFHSSIQKNSDTNNDIRNFSNFLVCLLV